MTTIDTNIGLYLADSYDYEDIELLSTGELILENGVTYKIQPRGYCNMIVLESEPVDNHLGVVVKPFETIEYTHTTGKLLYIAAVYGNVLFNVSK